MIEIITFVIESCVFPHRHRVGGGDDGDFHVSIR